jgi:hypothetical protein
MDDVDARLLHRAHVERVRVDELHDDDAEQVLVADAGGRHDVRQGSRAGRAAWTCRDCGEWFVANSLKMPCARLRLLVHDRVASPSINTFGSMSPVSGTTFPPSFSAYAMASESGWHGTGITSSGGTRSSARESGAGPR